MGHNSGNLRAVPAAAVPAPEVPDITIAAIPAVDLAGLYIAQDRGLFARQGLHVRIEPIPSAQSVIADQLRGKVDISAGSYVAYIAAQRQAPGSASWPRLPPWRRTRARWSSRPTRASPPLPG